MKIIIMMVTILGPIMTVMILQAEPSQLNMVVDQDKDKWNQLNNNSKKEDHGVTCKGLHVGHHPTNNFF